MPRIEARAQRLKSIDQWQALIPVLEAIPGVAAVSPLVTGPGFALAATRQVDRAVRRRSRALRPHRRIYDKRRRRHVSVEPGDAVIGKDLAKDLGLAVGDRFRLVTAEDGAERPTRSPSPRWSTSACATSIAGRSTSVPDRAEPARAARRRVADRPQGRPTCSAPSRSRAGSHAQTGLTVESWMRTNEQLLAAISAQDISTRMIRAFVILIVALGIASVLVVSVVQKRARDRHPARDGRFARPRQRVFLLQGAIVGGDRLAPRHRARLGVLFASARLARERRRLAALRPVAMPLGCTAPRVAALIAGGRRGRRACRRARRGSIPRRRSAVGSTAPAAPSSSSPPSARPMARGPTSRSRCCTASTSCSRRASSPR